MANSSTHMCSADFVTNKQMDVYKLLFTACRAPSHRCTTCNPTSPVSRPRLPQVETTNRQSTLGNALKTRQHANCASCFRAVGCCNKDFQPSSSDICSGAQPTYGGGGVGGITQRAIRELQEKLFSIVVLPFHVESMTRARSVCVCVLQ